MRLEGVPRTDQRRASGRLVQMGSMPRADVERQRLIGDLRRRVRVASERNSHRGRERHPPHGRAPRRPTVDRHPTVRAPSGRPEMSGVGTARADMAGILCDVYTYDMHKTTLQVDDAKLKRVRTILGTRGIKDTIDRALDQVLAGDSRRRELERLRKLTPADLGTMKKAWR